MLELPRRDGIADEANPPGTEHRDLPLGTEISEWRDDIDRIVQDVLKNPLPEG
jgi:hypothetical protein